MYVGWFGNASFKLGQGWHSRQKNEQGQGQAATKLVVQKDEVGSAYGFCQEGAFSKTKVPFFPSEFPVLGKENS